MTIAAIVCLVVALAYLVQRLRTSSTENAELKARIVVLKRELTRRKR